MDRIETYLTLPLLDRSQTRSARRKEVSAEAGKRRFTRTTEKHKLLGLRILERRSGRNAGMRIPEAWLAAQSTQRIWGMTGEKTQGQEAAGAELKALELPSASRVISVLHCIVRSTMPA